MKFLIAAVASLAIGLSSQSAFAQEHHGGGELPEFHTLLRAANLTADQQTQVHQLMKSTWTQQKSVHQQIQGLREQIADKLASTGSVQASDITSIQQQIAQLKAQNDAQWVQTALQIRGLLTSDQLRQVSSAHEQIKSLHAQLKAVVPDEPMAPVEMQAPAGTATPIAR